LKTLSAFEAETKVKNKKHKIDLNAKQQETRLKVEVITFLNPLSKLIIFIDTNGKDSKTQY
tara:strand:+ start:8304 stop:8486 length:183 start_codon:yes stop_codon:yes gene_type:complete